MASPSHVVATEGYFHRMGVSKTLPEAAQGKGYFSSLVRGQLKFDESQPGRVSLTFTVKPAFTNPYNTLHGGVVAAVAEIAGMECAKTAIAEKELFLGEFSTSYLAAARLNRLIRSSIDKLQQEVEVVGTTLRQGRSVTVVAVEFKVKETGKLHYTSRLTFYTMPVARL